MTTRCSDRIDVDGHLKNTSCWDIAVLDRRQQEPRGTGGKSVSSGGGFISLCRQESKICCPTLQGGCQPADSWSDTKQSACAMTPDGARREFSALALVLPEGLRDTSWIQLVDSWLALSGRYHQVSVNAVHETGCVPQCGPTSVSSDRDTLSNEPKWLLWQPRSLRKQQCCGIVGSDEPSCHSGGPPDPSCKNSLLQYIHTCPMIIGCHCATYSTDTEDVLQTDWMYYVLCHYFLGTF